MAIKITDECINCGACEPECPNNAIYEGGIEWAMSDGTSLSGDYILMDGSCVRDYIHVCDIANAHTLALQFLIDKKNKTNCEVFNLGTGNGVSVLEAIAAFEKVSNKKLNYSYYSRRKNI